MSATQGQSKSLPPINKSGAAAAPRNGAAAGSASKQRSKSSKKGATAGSSIVGRNPDDHTFHKCNCYGHEKGLPNYKLLAIPRTNNYYHATGGCPCIPRAPAHPGSWRLKEATMRSATFRLGDGCTEKSCCGGSHTQGKCCVHTGYQYGWKAGPHTVKGKNTAATGLCDTFGNMAFKSKSRAFNPALDDTVSEASSVNPGKLEDLEALILEEHHHRMRVEADLMELEEIQANGTEGLYKQEQATHERRRQLGEASEEQLNELLREIRDVVDKPLNQPNMEVVHRIIARQEHLRRQRAYQTEQTMKAEAEAQERGF